MRPQYAQRAAQLLRRYYSTPTTPSKVVHDGQLWGADTFDKRVQELKILPIHNGSQHDDSARLYPRLFNSQEDSTIHQLRTSWEIYRKHDSWTSQDNPVAESRLHRISGRVLSVRKHGKNLVFLNIAQGTHVKETLQVMCSSKALQSPSQHWSVFANAVKTGDIYSFCGRPEKTSGDVPTMKVTELPVLLAPSLHDRPTKLLDRETMARFPQLQLENIGKRGRLQVRSDVEFHMHAFFRKHRFVHVATPIIAADAGGAIAKPFVVKPSAVSERELYLRIAPELELKKLIAAGLDRVYEIGPSFRNEGLDATHNPEFTTCEFYQAYETLDGLIRTTQELLSRIAKEVVPEKATLFAQPFRKIQFLQGLEEQIRQRGIADFTFSKPFTQDSWQELLPLFSQIDLPEPKDLKHARTTHILDLLSSHLLEPLCKEPTVITDYPAIMSPLAKSYTCPTTGHELAARAELFINSTEYVNMYEEENSPFAQARKFLLQKLEQATDATTTSIKAADVDTLSHHEIVQQLSPAQRYYIRVLEMGLPPTAGWGCGIDRLVMLLTDAERISDVLPFGNLRNVIAMGT